MKICAWCKGEIPPTLRRDSICCSVRCRQARHRFTSQVGRGEVVDTGTVLRLAYADPPYPGLSKLYYSDHPDFAGEVDHIELIRKLSTYDGWALSTSAKALPSVLAMCPPGVRVAAWHRGERPTKSLGPLNAWEPVIYFGGRLDFVHDASPLEDRRVARSRDDASFDRDATRDAGESRRDASPLQSRRVDSLVYHSRPRLSDPARVIGAKPATFCRWIFDLLGAQPQDSFEDLFPGSGGVLRAWHCFSQDASSTARSDALR
jgi:hypothetical protein